MNSIVEQTSLKACCSLISPREERDSGTRRRQHEGKGGRERVGERMGSKQKRVRRGLTRRTQVDIQKLLGLTIDEGETEALKLNIELKRRLKKNISKLR